MLYYITNQDMMLYRVDNVTGEVWYLNGDGYLLLGQWNCAWYLTGMNVNNYEYGWHFKDIYLVSYRQAKHWAKKKGYTNTPPR